MARSLSDQIASLNRKVEAISQKEVKAAYSRAINRTAQRSRTHLKRKISEETGIKPGMANKLLYVESSTIKTQRAKLKAYRRGFAAIRLLTPAQINRAKKVARKVRGVTVAGKLYPSSFIATSSLNNKQHVFQRKTRKQYPLKSVRVDVANVVDAETLPIVQRMMDTEFKKVLMQELKYRISKYANKTRG